VLEVEAAQFTFLINTKLISQLLSLNPVTAQSSVYPAFVNVAKETGTPRLCSASELHNVTTRLHAYLRQLSSCLARNSRYHTLALDGEKEHRTLRFICRRGIDNNRQNLFVCFSRNRFIYCDVRWLDSGISRHLCFGYCLWPADAKLSENFHIRELPCDGSVICPLRSRSLSYRATINESPCAFELQFAGAGCGNTPKEQ
jgi:hypothetical protein